MGLTVHLRYAAAPGGDAASVRATIAGIHAACSNLPGVRVGRITDMGARAIHAAYRQMDAPRRWMVIQHRQLVCYRRDEHGVPILLPDLADGAGMTGVLADRIIGFTMEPGDGCEPLNIALATHPDSVAIPPPPAQPGIGTHRLQLPANSWFGTCFCKTIYASDPDCGGPTNFLRCHLAVIAAAEAISAAGCSLTVHDEGGYWETRSIPGLLAAANCSITGIRSLLESAQGPGRDVASPLGRPGRPLNRDAAIANGDGLLDLIRHTRAENSVRM